MPKEFFKQFGANKRNEIKHNSYIPFKFDKLDSGYFDTFYKERREMLRKELLSVFNI
jgi:hypothetical protein